MADQYAAFISYSHADERWAGWLQRRLESYRGTDSADRHPMRPVFRDRSDLAAGALGPAIEEALSTSAALIVICSPEAKNSAWVAQEIRTYRAKHSNPQVLPFVVDADPANTYDSVFPAALLETDAGEKAEFLAADARKDKDGKHDAFLKIAAALQGVNFDTLKRRADRTRFRRLLGATIGSAVVAVGAVVLLAMTLLARQEAEQRRYQAEELVTFMIGDLRDELGETGRLDLLDAVGDEALAYFESVDSEDETPELLLQRGRAFRQIGDVRVDQGNTDAGIELYEVAVLTLNRAAQLVTDGSLNERINYETAQTYLASAGVYYMRGDMAASRADMLVYRSRITELSEQQPDNLNYIAELVTANNNLGAIAFARDANEEAQAFFQSGFDTATRLIEMNPDSAELRAQVAGLEIWLGNVAERRDDIAAALRRYESAVENHRFASRLDPNTINREALARSLTIISVAAQDTDPYLALDYAREATGLMRDLVTYEPDNRIWQQRLNRSLGIEIGSAILLGCDPDIPRLLDEARQSSERLLALDESVLEVQRDLVDVNVLAARYAMGTGEPAAAERFGKAAYDRATEVLALNPKDDLSARYLLRAAEVLARSQLMQADELGAGNTAQQVAQRLQGTTIEDPSATVLLTGLARAAENDWSGWPPEPGEGRRGCDV